MTCSGDRSVKKRVAKALADALRDPDACRKRIVEREPPASQNLVARGKYTAALAAMDDEQRRGLWLYRAEVVKAFSDCRELIGDVLHEIVDRHEPALVAAGAAGKPAFDAAWSHMVDDIFDEMIRALARASADG